MLYEELLTEANKLGIIVKEYNLKTRKGRCCGNRIVINKNLTTQEKCCVLAEELGHYHLTVGDISNQSNISNRKQEVLARRWGYKKNAGILDLINAFKAGCKTKYEIAEFLNITEKYLNEAIEYYTSKYGAYYTIDCYNIMFIPNFRIGKAFF
nr:ImmA/IrrE family metallo-endopeptidase [Clostridium thermobutyricum]